MTLIRVVMISMKNSINLPPTLAAIKRKIAAQEHAARMMSSRKKKLRRNSKEKVSSRTIKRVQFIEEVQEIPPAELLIDERNETEGIILNVFPRSTDDSMEMSADEQEIVLASFNLAGTLMKSHQNNGNNLHSMKYRVTTGIALSTLWKKYNLPGYTNNRDFRNHLVQCVRAKWIHVLLLTLSSSLTNQESVILRIILTEDAVKSTRELPLFQKRSQRKKHAMANALQSVIKSMFGISKAAPIYRNENKGLDEITAKRIYKLVDNKQLEAYNNTDKGFPKLNIEGLVPTLRPYQAAAVQWMLERERMAVHGDEWKIAWFVLNSATREVTPLTKIDEANEGTKAFVFFCPFNGWIAKTIEEAKRLTIGGRMHPVRGGCLAEQMGLGKTVEVLACILAHPMPEEGVNSSGDSCRRRLFEEDENVKDADVHVTEQRSCEDAKLGVVSGMDDFGDADSSDDDSEQKTQVVSPSFSDSGTPAVVTPEKLTEVAEQHWIDEFEVGSCICGEIITFPRIGQKQKSKIVLCLDCNEPMHQECSCFNLNDISTLKRLDLRRTFGNETLECVLDEHCPCCAVNNNRAPIKSKATVVICPPAILEQWEREIKRHTRRKNGESLKVLVYDSVEKISKGASRYPGGMKLLHPKYLADTDIILMPFQALMSDLGHSDENRFIFQGGEDSSNLSCSLRKRKKYRIVPSPLLSLHFWRICIDEAQRVEVTTTKAAQMALKLKGEFYWAVSGTPIGHGKLQDLHGLLHFLRLAPFDNREWFHSCLSPFVDGVDDRIQDLLHCCLWRSTKAAELVKKQIGIPEMSERQIVLKFSSIERHFYNRQLEKTLEMAGKMHECADEKLNDKANRLGILSENIHQLRAACCHPQVGSSGVSGGRLKKSRQRRTQRDSSNNDSSVASRVLSMEQILEMFIDDARQKCEEAQRLAIMHTNAMAGLTILQVEARCRGINVTKDDHSLLMEGGKLYQDSLLLAQKNATPSIIYAGAVLNGNIGFCSPNLSFNDGKCRLGWKMQTDFDQVWAKIEYEGPSRKLTKVRVRPLTTLPADVAAENSSEFSWELAVPKAAVLQISTPSSGGEFVNVGKIPLGSQDSWVEIDSCHRVNKSKWWRIVLEMGSKYSCSDGRACFLGIEVELFEPLIDSDPLQLLHSLHNACLSYGSAIDLSREANDEETVAGIGGQIDSMRKEADQIESLHKAHVQTLHKVGQSKFQELTKKRVEKESELFELTSSSKSIKEAKDCWDDGWYDDFLGLVNLYGSDTQGKAVFDRIIQDVEGIYADDDSMRFPDFTDMAGFRTALRMRLFKIRDEGLGKKQISLPATTADDEFVQIRSVRYKCGAGEHSSCMKSIQNLSPNPEPSYIYENRHCRLCKADWNQTGPICSHCRIAEVLQDLRPDSVSIAVLTAVHSAVRSPVGMTLLETKEALHIADRAKCFFEVLEAEEREKVGAWRMWRIHLELLNSLDELASCKQSMRLSMEGEDLTKYTPDQLNAIIQPFDIRPQYSDHEAKQSMSLGDLRRATGTLRYLQNQQVESCHESSTPDSCVVCLLPLDSECCVLKCGHRFHQKPCFEQILQRSGSRYVNCPMKCRSQTARGDEMVASNKSRHDGSGTERQVKGSYGTKVTRIVSDILCMRDKGEKGVVFSQWNDMLDIIELALLENGVVTARPRDARHFGMDIRSFQSPDCSVLLLNLKQGAEGLTLVQATNVFMIEPVMNSGLDQQAINRIHRIGQTKHTFVWRYMIADTIEMKLDQIRLKHQADDEVLEDTLTTSSHSAYMYSAGGIDGGFESQEELLGILS